MTPDLQDVSPERFPAFLQDLLEGHIMPARKIRPSSHKNTGYVPSSKGCRVQRTESLLEQEFFTLLDYDRRVAAFQSQPFKIRWKDKLGRLRSYTPDVVVTYSQEAMAADPSLKTTIFEVKPRIKIKQHWEELHPRFRAAVRWAKLYGCRFSIVTEKEIHTPFLANVEHLTAYRTVRLGMPAYGGPMQRILLDALKEGQIETPRSLLLRLSSDPERQAELIPWLWNLVTQNLIGVDLVEPLTMVSPIWITKRGLIALEHLR
ncbi:TnsA endonuclease N-terminal domain-containing protein [Pseudomonas nicosulfuronedens]